ncbi:MAG: hypothetical protein K8H86_12670, partial [Ignavibacteriaceae bacterium]|nr:hypothetical protein [Ignavibacteriaceae bacterium]
TKYYLIPLHFILFFLCTIIPMFGIKYLLIKLSIVVSYFLNSTNRSQDAMLIFNNKLKLVYANKSALRIFDSDYSFWRGKDVSSLRKNNKELFAIAATTLKSSRRKIDLLTINKKGNYIKIKCTCIPLKSPWRLNIAVYIRLEDISEQILSERQKVLAHSVQKVAHEIKTPLASILLNLDSIEENIGDNTESVLKDISTSRQEIYRIRNFINSFLKLTNSHLPTFTPIKAELLINNALLRFSSYMAHNIKIEVSGDIHENVLCDSSQIEDTLQVFIENAIDAMNGQGKIVIKCRKLALGNRSYLEFNIADEGMGIDEKIRNSLFDPYTTTKLHGSGMGMAIAKKILDDHDCKINIKARDISGTIIVFKLLIAD